jgi:hypothetical protein
VRGDGLCFQAAAGQGGYALREIGSLKSKYPLFTV